MRTVVIEVPKVKVVETTTDSLQVLKETAPQVIEVGIAGSQGPKGDKGDSADASFRYVHTQGLASTSWVVLHNLNGFPNVAVVDSAGTTIEGEIVYVSANEIMILFTAPFGGKAYLS
jgi:hypothetical protein